MNPVIDRLMSELMECNDKRMEAEVEIHNLKSKLAAAERERDGLAAKCAACGLSFAQLRKANVRRCEQVFHPVDAWTTAEWACAMAGEAGEVCNAVKKLRRLADGTNTSKDPQTVTEAKEAIGNEIADTIIYLDLLAAKLELSLSDVVCLKFNAVSERMKSNITLSQADCGRDYVPRKELDESNCDTGKGDSVALYVPNKELNETRAALKECVEALEKCLHLSGCAKTTDTWGAPIPEYYKPDTACTCAIGTALAKAKEALK